MIQRIVRALAVCSIASAVIVPALPTMACGPDFSPPVLTQAKRPDVPIEDFADGRMGIVLSSYSTSYLVVAYRYFSGKPLTDEEQKQFLSLWNRYHGPGGMPEQYAGPDSSGWASALDSWEKQTGFTAPTEAEHPMPGGAGATNVGEFEVFDSCLTDAYANAALTLQAREKEFGAGGPEVRGWVRAQLAVFQNCTKPGSDLPNEAGNELPLEIRQDRDYQIAAAYFYADRWDEAEKRFLAIEADTSSPWRATAALVAARCEIRKATLGTDKPEEQTKYFMAAEDQLQKIAADPTFISVKPGAERLRGFVEFRVKPDERAIEIANLLQKADSPDSFAQYVDDYSKLIDQRGDDLENDPGSRAKSDMTDWIVTYKLGNSPEAEAHAISRWRATQSSAWMIAALAHAHANTEQLNALLTKAASVPQKSPAYLTIAFLRNVLFAQTGKREQTRNNLDALLAVPKERMPISSRNLLLALRMKTAANLDEFLRNASRVPAAGAPDYDELAPPESAALHEPMFDVDASMIFSERMPLSMLIDAAKSNSLPDALRRQVAIAAWTRAIVLHNDAAAQQAAPALAAAIPELKDELAQYTSANDAAARQVDALLILLENPGLEPFIGTRYSRTSTTWQGNKRLSEIDSFRDNWWCGVAPQDGDTDRYSGRLTYTPDFSDSSALQEIYPGGKIASPAFLMATERNAAGAEWKSIRVMPDGSKLLAQQAVSWAKAHADDPRAPEALHDSVRALRYGCGPGDGKLSREAFTILHSRYPTSEWTAKTPFWFN